MEKMKLFFSALLVLVATNVALAQSGKVTGVVKDSGTGEPIPFASIMEKGTMNGVSADGNGEYTIAVSDKSKAILVASSVGYKNFEFAVVGRDIIDLELYIENVLEDVVVVAYGTVKKEAVTGSVSSVKGEGLAAVPVTSVDKMLTGKLAGVNISTTSGQPGATSQIRIRGNGSINASNAPLWVVDGIPIITMNTALATNTNNTLSGLNPNDIESITILKDAAAAAAYGSRAANGVILVTTKSGQAGKAQFDVRAKYGVNWLQSDSGFRMMTGRELLGYYRDAARNAGYNPDDPTSTYYFPMSIAEKPMYNWMDFVTRPGSLQEYEVSGRGGNSKGKFFSSFLYQKNDGVFYGVNYNKIQGRVNTSYKLLNNLEMGMRMNLSYSKSSDVPMQSLYMSNPIWAAQTILPWTPTTNPDGSFNLNIPENSNENPRNTVKYNDQWDKNFNLSTVVSLKWTPVQNLVLETKNSFEGVFAYSRQFINPEAYGHPSEAVVAANTFRNLQMVTSNTATYANTFGQAHNVRVVAGQEATVNDFYLLGAMGPGINVDIPYLPTADQTKSTASENLSRETMMSFFGIADYNYDNRYFVQANIRRDGSSLFGAKKRWGTFWSGSASWNISNEKFFNVRPISLLKLRASYGVNGNNAIGNYAAYGLYSTITYNGITGLTSSQPANENLSWEKNKTWNVGLDFGFLDNRISGSVDVYQRKTVDMLLTKKVPQTSGWSGLFTNVGSLMNSGVEVQLNADIIRKSDMIWSVGANAAFNKTKVLDLAGADFLGDWQRTVVGKSMYTYYLYDYYGVNPSNGEALFVHEDEEGNLSLTNDFSKARRHYCGSPEPKVVGGFNTDFQWKGLSLGVFFEFKAGHKNMQLNEMHYLHSDGAEMHMNQMAIALDYWKQPGDVGVNPKPVAGNTSSSNDFLLDRWLVNASYLRLKDVTLSYNLPAKAVKAMHLRGLRFYVSGLNLYCFHDVPDYDPERGVNGTGAGIYPLTKSFIGGLEVSF